MDTHFQNFKKCNLISSLVFEKKDLWYSSIRSCWQIFHNMVRQWLFLRYIKWLWYEAVKRNPFIFHMFLNHYLLQRKMSFFWCSKWSKPLAWIIELVNILYALSYHIGSHRNFHTYSSIRLYLFIHMKKVSWILF